MEGNIEDHDKLNYIVFLFLEINAIIQFMLFAVYFSPKITNVNSLLILLCFIQSIYFHTT